MAITSTPIPQKKVGAIATDIRGGGGYTTYYENGKVVRRTYVGGGGASEEQVKRIAERVFRGVCRDMPKFRLRMNLKAKV